MWAAHPNRGGEDHKPGLRRELFEPLDIPQLPVTSTGNGVRYLNKRGPSLHRTADRKIRPSSRDVASSGRRATAPRTDNSCVRTHQLSLYPEGCNGCASPDGQATDNDPSAGSPTETLLRLLLPLNATVWSSSRQAGRVIRLPNSPRTSLKRSIGSSDGRCVQRAGT